MNEEHIGSFGLILHSHLPFVVGHGRWPHGTDWLFEASAECYIPLLRTFEKLAADGITPKVTVSLSPILCEQLAHPAFVEQFPGYLELKVKAAEDDIAAFGQTGHEHRQKLAVMWRDFYRGIRDDFEHRYDRNMIGAFKRLQDEGHIEVMTCAATHGYLPLLSRDESVSVQIKLAVKNYTKHFGRKPRGIWLPECAYRPRYDWAPPLDSPIGRDPHTRKGVDEFLSEEGLSYFVIDSALLKGGRSIGVYIDRFEALRSLWGQYEKSYRPRPEEFDKTPREIYWVNSSGEPKQPVAVMTRDPETGLQVWSGEWGYPGDGNYLDFHKKHFPGGHRYWKVTSAMADLADKMEYDPDAAALRIPENADHFAGVVRGNLAEYRENSPNGGILCAPFDAELFGHWWFEGPQFIEHCLAALGSDPQLRLATCSEMIAGNPPTRVISIPEGSWGEGGHHYIWLNENTEWSWKHIYPDEARMQKLAAGLASNNDPIYERVVRRAAVELLLLCSSDWQFLISTWAARDYAEMRLARHHENFEEMASLAEKIAGGDTPSDAEWATVAALEEQDNIFPELELDWFASVKYPAK